MKNLEMKGYLFGYSIEEVKKMELSNAGLQLPEVDKEYNAIPYRLSFNQLVLTLGYRCNLNCSSCFIGEKLTHSQEAISYNEAIQTIESCAALQTVNSVAFVGGEPFLYYQLMLKIISYIWKHYQCFINISTNAIWATTEKKAQLMLQPLVQRGLKWMLVSLDEFHMQTGNLDPVINCLKVCMELGVNITIQTLEHKKSIPTETFKEKISSNLDIDSFTWLTNPVTPLGNAATRIKKEYLTWTDHIPGGTCNAGEFLNIQPDGEVKPCCGAGLDTPRLSIGNIKHGSLYQMVKECEVDPVLNLLIAHQGAEGIYQFLHDSGHLDLATRHAPFSDSCGACHALLHDPDILEVFNNQLPEVQVQLLTKRILNVHTMEVVNQSTRDDG